MTSLPGLTTIWLEKQILSKFTVGRPLYSDQDDVYRIKANDGIYYLKISEDLSAEHQNLLRVRPFLFVPKIVGYEKLDSKDHLLTSEVSGKNLAELPKESDPHSIVKEFASAVKQFHALDAGKIFPGKAADGLVILHGDMSLPNIISIEPGSFGYIDLGQMSVGLPEDDLADAIWSLQRNLGPHYGELFLSEYGEVKMTEKLQKALDFRHDPNFKSSKPIH